MTSRVLVSSEHRFFKDSSGTIWTSSQFQYSFWTRYLDVFDDTTIVARVLECSDILPEWHQVTGKGVSFHSLPHYIGPLEYLMQWPKLRQAVRRLPLQEAAVILRVPSPIAGLMLSFSNELGHPYGAEVVGDPYDVFAPGAVRHPFRPVFRRYFAAQLKQQVRGASAAAYVTEVTLQQRFPTAVGAFATSYSSIELPVDQIVEAPRRAPLVGERVSLILVGSLEQLYKAPDVLIDAVAICVRCGFDLQLSIVGDGKHRSELEDRAQLRGIQERVRFTGQLPAGMAVRAELDHADLFVLPSRTEGLPRALIEAMARGLPCIGSTAGGIPELLSTKDLVPPGNAQALADKICEVLSNPSRMERMAARNLEKAREYHEDVLRARRCAFYQYVKDRTEEWFNQQSLNL